MPPSPKLPLRPERGRLELDGRRVRGFVPWPYDDFYRPTIGLFVDGVLQRTAPTFRRRSAGAEEWRCAFEIDLEDLGKDIPRVTMVCLETGALLHRLRNPGGRADPPGAVSAEDVVAAANDARAPLRCDGFCSFLDLSETDQIDFLYFCLLGRSADPGGLANYRRQLRANELTILDVRDQMLASDEFKRAARPKVSSNFLHWIVWGGIGEALPRFALRGSADETPPRPAVEVGALELDEPANLGSHLARIALGRRAEPDRVSQWRQDHSDRIAEMAREIERRREMRAAG